MDNIELIELAKKAREKAFVPMSHFKVGAALLTKEGKVFLGCNIEDPSGVGALNVCAERCAVFKAISEGCMEFEKIACVGGIDELIFTTPCGVCRQLLNSYNHDMKVVCEDKGEIREFSIQELLPYTFNETFGNKD